MILGFHFNKLKMKKTLVIIMTLILIFIVACESESEVIYEAENNTYTPEIKEGGMSTQYAENKTISQENITTENNEMKKQPQIEELAELELEKKNGDIIAYLTLNADEINKKEILALTAKINYDQDLFNMQYEKTIEDLVCQYKELYNEISCAAPFKIPNTKILVFKFSLKKELVEKKTGEIEITINKLNAEKVNIQLKEEFSLGCSTGLECGEGDLCINGLCRGDCSINQGTTCSYAEDGKSFKGICVQKEPNKAICDTENVVKVGSWSKYRGYWSDCKAPKVLIERNKELENSEDRLFHKETCDPGTLEDGFQPIGVCYFGDCLINKPNLQITSIKKINTDENTTNIEITIKNTGIKEAYFDGKNMNIIRAELCENEECIKTTKLNDAKDSYLRLGVELSRKLTIKTNHKEINKKIRVIVDPDNKISESIEEDNIKTK